MNPSAYRRALAGFFVSGLMFSFIGSVLPAWGYHLRPHYAVVGGYFLAVNAGVLLAVAAARPAIARRGTGWTLTLACWVAVASLMGLAITEPPAPEVLRLPGLTGLGFAAGLLNTAIFHAITPAYRLNPAATVNLGGALFGMGSMLTPLLIAGTFDLFNLPLMCIVVASIPAAFAILYWRTKFAAEPLARERAMRDTLREFTIPGAVLLAMLLFFHFGNEWAIAGWLPLFLIQRLGKSPATALGMAAVYWAALVTGRLAVQAILSRAGHFWLLLGSAIGALFGCLVLTFTNNQFGAWMGVLLLGFGFAPIYPLVVEKIGARFPNYQPGVFNGIFSVGLTGGMLAPATLGYAGEFFGIGIVMALPALGTFVVVLLVLAIWLEAKLSEWNSAKGKNDRIA